MWKVHFVTTDSLKVYMCAAAGISFQLLVHRWFRHWWPVISCLMVDETHLMDELQLLFHTPSQLSQCSDISLMTSPSELDFYSGWTKGKETFVCPTLCSRQGTSHVLSIVAYVPLCVNTSQQPVVWLGLSCSHLLYSTVFTHPNNIC